MVAVHNPEIRKAADTLYELSSDDKVRAEYEMHLKAWRDKMSDLEEAREDGIQTGIQTGMKAGMQAGMKAGMQKALELLQSGKTPEEIMQIM